MRGALRDEKVIVFEVRALLHACGIELDGNAVGVIDCPLDLAASEVAVDDVISGVDGVRASEVMLDLTAVPGEPLLPKVLGHVEALVVSGSQHLCEVEGLSEVVTLAVTVE